MTVTAKSKPRSKAKDLDGAEGTAGAFDLPATRPQEPREDAAADAGPELKKQELLEKLVRRADVQKKLAKPVLDAVLEVLGEALAEGRDLNLPPLGKLKVNRVRDMAQARVIVAKIRQPKVESLADVSMQQMDAKVAVADDPD